MSSGELSFHNLYEFFSSGNEKKGEEVRRRRRSCSLEKCSDGICEEKKTKERIFVLYEGKHKKTSQNFNPEVSFLSARKTRKEKKMKESGKRKEKIIILLCYSKHVKISFHYVLNAPCAYYAFLISSKLARKTAAGIWMWIEKMEAKNSAAQRNVIYFLGNENENVSQRTRYTALRLSFGLWFAFVSTISLRFFYLRASRRKGRD